MDKKGRTCLHYAAINDSAKLIETVFLVAKTTPSSIREVREFEKDNIANAESNDPIGAVDDRFEDMDN